MGKHTPGPWRVEKEHISTCHGKSIWSSKGMEIAQVAGLAFFDEANARLIAAAPEMLEALKSAATMFPGVPYPDERKLLENITALIARIEGGE